MRTVTMRFDPRTNQMTAFVNDRSVMATANFDHTDRQSVADVMNAMTDAVFAALNRRNSNSFMD